MRGIGLLPGGGEKLGGLIVLEEYSTTTPGRRIEFDADLVGVKRLATDGQGVFKWQGCRLIALKESHKPPCGHTETTSGYLRGRTLMSTPTFAAQAGGQRSKQGL